MPRHSGKTGKVFAQVGGGELVPWTALADSGSHREFAAATGKYPWKSSPAPLVRINGVRSGLEVTIDNAAANDTVDVTAGKVYLAGQPTDVGAGSVASLDRPATPGNVVINCITVTSAGALALVSGTEGAPGGARGAAGGPPFIPTGSILLAEIALVGTAAAAILASEIDNTVQERADVPGYRIDYFNGKVSTQLALEAIHTGSIPRAVYAQWRVAVFSEVFDLSEWSLDLTKDTADTEGFGDDFKVSVPVMRSWSGSLTGYLTSPFWFQLANRDDYALLKLRTSEDDPYEWQGIANVEWSTAVSATDAVSEDVSFTGVGELKLEPVTE